MMLTLPLKPPDRVFSPYSHAKVYFVVNPEHQDKVSKSAEQWRAELTADQFRVCREGATEVAFSGKYYNCHIPGTYTCVCCGEALFSAATKFDSGSGWPSFYQPYNSENVKEEKDLSHGVRNEVCCSRCGAHLGHVFPDGPTPTGLRYCINSVALQLAEEADEE